MCVLGGRKKKKKCRASCLFFSALQSFQSLGTCHSVCSQFRKGWAQSLWGTVPRLHPHPHPMSPARNKAAIVDSPNFAAACRNFLSPSLQQVLYAWISQVWVAHKNLRLLLRRLSTPSLTLPSSLPFRRLHRAICFHLSNSSIRHKRKCCHNRKFVKNIVFTSQNAL